MLLEAFDRLSASGKAKYRIDIVGHSGESAEIPFVNVDALPTNSGDRWKIVEKMALITQYCWPGDETLNALNKAVDAVAEADAGALSTRSPRCYRLTYIAVPSQTTASSSPSQTPTLTVVSLLSSSVRLSR